MTHGRDHLIVFGRKFNHPTGGVPPAHWHGGGPGQEKLPSEDGQ